ncbi:hypothetical protein RYX36_003668 [Vicia faba]
METRIVTQLMICMDEAIDHQNLETRGHVLVIGATNNLSAIESALRRPGRFYPVILVPVPDQSSRGVQGFEPNQRNELRLVECKGFTKNLETELLLFGPPGCGKTLIAKAVANKAGANFIHVKIDALTKERGKEGGQNIEGVLNQLLIELDGAENRKGVFVIGATNSYIPKKHFFKP